MGRQRCLSSRAKLGGQATVVAVDEAASLGYLFFHYPSPFHCLDIGLGILGGNVLLKLMKNFAKKIKYYPGSVGELTVRARTFRLLLMRSTPVISSLTWRRTASTAGTAIPSGPCGGRISRPSS